jgi:hypothetical protein
MAYGDDEDENCKPGGALHDVIWPLLALCALNTCDAPARPITI